MPITQRGNGDENEENLKEKERKVEVSTASSLSTIVMILGGSNDPRDTVRSTRDRLVYFKSTLG